MDAPVIMHPCTQIRTSIGVVWLPGGSTALIRLVLPLYVWRWLLSTDYVMSAMYYAILITTQTILITTQITSFSAVYLHSYLQYDWFYWLIDMIDWLIELLNDFWLGWALLWCCWQNKIVGQLISIIYSDIMWQS